ncbi:MAG: hypothetical protein REI09_10405 [Candidatus Dactylopiibacterium sp.]|nr:hypothetical protein [Candidatus Dactylopiibacterium sp.]
MIEILKQSLPGRVSAAFVHWANQLLVPAMLRRRVFSFALVLNLLAGLYWGFIASDRYISEARVLVQRTDLAGGQSMDFAGLLSGLGSTNHADQLILRDYLLSEGLLRKLDARLNLRKHFSGHSADVFSRLSEGAETIEEFHRYFLSRVSVEFDEYAGVLVIKAQAYTPDMAHAIARAMVEEGERHLNELGHTLAREQVQFLEQQVAVMNARANAARQAVLRYQNAKGLVSPQGEVETRASIAARLEGQMAELNTRRTALLAYLMPESSKVGELDAQIAAVRQQIEAEKSRLAAPGGNTLNSTVEEYQRLTTEAEFTGTVYKTALVALEKGRVEALRLLKKVSVLQAPTLPEFPLQPRRLYNFVVFLIVSMLVAGIVQLIAAIIRDHKD